MSREKILTVLNPDWQQQQEMKGVSSFPANTDHRNASLLKYAASSFGMGSYIVKHCIVWSLLAGSLLDKIDVIGIQVVIVSSNVGLAFGNLLLKDSFIELLEVFNMVEMQVGRVGLKKTCVIVLSSLMLSWAISFVAFTFVFTFVLINHLGINEFEGN